MPVNEIFAGKTFYRREALQRHLTPHLWAIFSPRFCPLKRSRLFICTKWLEPDQRRCNSTFASSYQILVLLKLRRNLVWAAVGWYLGTGAARCVFKHGSPTTNLPLVYNLLCSVAPRQMEDECTEDKEYAEDEPEINNGGGGGGGGVVTNTRRAPTWRLIPSIIRAWLRFNSNLGYNC